MFGSTKKDAAFFDAFAGLAVKSEEAAGMLVEMFSRMTIGTSAAYRRPGDAARVDAETKALAKKIKEAETAGDEIQRATIRRLRENWITPLDRYDIHELILGLDSVLNYIEAVADRIVLFEVSVAPDEGKDLAALLVKACSKVVAALKLLSDMKNAPQILALCDEVFKLETDADKVYRQALASLFEESSEPLMVMKWRDIFDNLESAIDRCQVAGSIIQGVVLEYA